MPQSKHRRKGITRQTAKAPAVVSTHRVPFRRIPDDIRADIAQIVHGVEFIDAPNDGICLGRAKNGQWLLKMLRVETDLIAGGLVFRAGPHPVRDCVAFCGPDSAGQYVPGVGLLGHIWLETRNEIIDFSTADWKAGMTPELRLPAGLPLLGSDELTTSDGDPGDIQWDVEPPDYLWCPTADLMPIDGQDAPGIGQAWYCGWNGPPPPLDNEIDWRAIHAYFVESCKHHDLAARIGNA